MWGYLAKASEFADKAKAAASEAATKAAEQAAVAAEEVKKASAKAAEQAQKAAEQAQASDFMAQAQKAAEQAKAAASNAADSISKTIEATEDDMRRFLAEQDCRIFVVRPELIVMEFPGEEKIGRLSAKLNADYDQRMLIYNMSEKRYDTTQFRGEVVDVAFRGLPAPPLAMLMELCLSAHQWLSSEPEKVLVVHCFLGFSRSAVFLSCFLAFRGLYPHPVDALHHVCQRLGIDDTAVLPSQRRYLTYFQQCQQGFVPSSSKLRLRRVTMSGVPKMEEEGSIACRPYVEVWNQGMLVHASWSGSGEAPDPPLAVEVGEASVSFDIPEEVVVSGDILMRVRHVGEGAARATACRLAFNTAFVQGKLQIAKRELDGACDDERFPDDAFVELDFESADEEGVSSEAPPVFQKARELSKRLCEEEHRRSEEERRRLERQRERELEKQREAGLAQDEGDDLEETLRRAAERPAPSGERRRSAQAEATDAEELKKALAAAAAEDEATAAAPANASVVAQAPAVTKAHGDGGDTTADSAAKAVSDLAAEADNDIDALFNDFDAALASVGSDAKASAKPATAAAKPASDSKAAAPATAAAAPEKPAPSSTFEPLSAVIDFRPPPRRDVEDKKVPDTPATEVPSTPAAPLRAQASSAGTEAEAEPAAAAKAEAQPAAAAKAEAQPAAPVAKVLLEAAARKAEEAEEAPKAKAEPAAKPKAAPKDREDIFADMDAFLAELEG